MKRAVIYVPGLGDHRSRNQRIILSAWQVWGVKTAVVTMNWLVKEPFEAKLDRLLERIDRFSADGYQVSLVGVSAGASAVMNAFAVRQDVVHRVVCICGKLDHPGTIAERTYVTNPGFGESVRSLSGSLLGIEPGKIHRILSIRPLADETVPPEDTVIPGALSKTIPTRGHVFSIAVAITLYSWSIVSFIKRP